MVWATLPRSVNCSDPKTPTPLEFLNHTKKFHRFTTVNAMPLVKLRSLGGMDRSDDRRLVYVVQYQSDVLHYSSTY